MEEHDRTTEKPAQQPGVGGGEESSRDDSKEADRHDVGTSGADRPVGTATARDATGINPQDPIDPASPKLPPP